MSKDTIYRQDTIDALRARFRDKWWNGTRVLAVIEGLPSADSKNDYKKALDCILTAYLNPEIRQDILEKFVFETFSVDELKAEPKG